MSFSPSLELNQTLINTAVTRFNVDPASVTRLSSFANLIYAGTAAGSPAILRLTPAERYTADEILAELEWLAYLDEHGVAVSTAIPSPRGRLIEPITAADHTYFAITFHPAPGRPVNADALTPHFINKWGQQIGRMHALAQTFTPTHHRPTWESEPSIVAAEKWLPSNQPAVVHRWRALQAELAALPTTAGAFGLSHNDLHLGNMHVDNGRMTLFDFDNCTYNWFAADLAVLFYHVLQPHPAGEPRNTCCQTFAQHFWDGYTQFNTLEEQWLHAIPRFIFLREMVVYIVHSLQAQLLPPSEEAAAQLQRLRHNIETDTPFVPPAYLLPA